MAKKKAAPRSKKTDIQKPSAKRGRKGAYPSPRMLSPKDDAIKRVTAGGLRYMYELAARLSGTASTRHSGPRAPRATPMTKPSPKKGAYPGALKNPFEGKTSPSGQLKLKRLG